MTDLKDTLRITLFDLLDGEYYFTAEDYAEPGYSLENGHNGIVFANWNDKSRYDESTGRFVTVDDTMPRLAVIAEWLGYDCQWSDEWYVCEECNHAYRCNPDSYSWMKYGYEQDGGCTCGNCAQTPTGAREYIDYLSDNPKRANTLLPEWKMGPLGYKQVPIEFENGLYGGQDADPSIIMQTLHVAGVRPVIFSIDSTGQFDLAFSVWVHRDIVEHATKVLEEGNTRGADPAKAMQSALKDASAKLGNLPDGQGIKYARCKPNGTADVRLVSPQEWLDGIK